MTAIEAVLNSGEYQHAQANTLDVILRNPYTDDDPRASKRFLTRIITRAVLDVSMYPSTDERHCSARNWLLDKVPTDLQRDHDFVVTLSDLSCIVDMDDLHREIVSLATEEGAHRDKVRDLKKQLYNWCENDGEEQST